MIYSLTFNINVYYQVLPDKGVVLHVLDVVLLRHVARGQVPDAIHRDDADVLNCSQ